MLTTGFVKYGAALLALCLALLWTGHAAAARQTPTPSVTIAPMQGSQFQSFAATGKDFVPGTALETWWRSPDDEWFTTYVNDAPAVTTVETDGTFRVVVVPAIDFAGARAGKWTLYVCISGVVAEHGDCWTAEFTVTP